MGDISTADVMAVLLPIWNEKPETARRVRQRIGAIMKWAVAQGLPGGQSCWRRPWRGATEDQRCQEAPSRAAAYQGYGRHRDGPGVARALGNGCRSWSTLILTAARSGEVRESPMGRSRPRDGNVDGSCRQNEDEARAPGSAQRAGIAESWPKPACECADGTGLIFPSVTGRPLSDNTLSKLLREQGIPAVVHGFRSSFRDWCAECSNAPREVSELALAHVNSDWVEAAYMRTDLFERRRGLMQSWADYVSKGDLDG